MKKIIAIVIAFVMAISLTACGEIFDNQSEDRIDGTSFFNDVYEISKQEINIDFYDIEDNFISELSRQYGDGTHFAIYGANELTKEILEHRTEWDKIVIERCIGIVTNEEHIGDGKILNINDSFNYICYNSVNFEKPKGTIILTYFIYNPNSNYIDDIMERYDFVL